VLALEIHAATDLGDPLIHLDIALTTILFQQALLIR